MNHSFSILPSQANQRFDRFVARIFDKAKNAEVYRIIREGKIKVNKKKKRNEYILTEGDEITIWMSDEAIAELRTKKRAIHPKNKSFQVIFEDDDYLILDKPSGLPVHGGTNIKGRTLIQEILGYLNHHDAIGGFQPTFINRLDRDTCGIMVVAKTYKALQEGGKMIQDKDMTHKIYRARIVGIPDHGSGDITFPLKIQDDAKIGSAKVRIAKDKEGGSKTAHTSWRIIRKEAATKTSIIEVQLHTGRTHQIRVHMAAIGHPLVGDDKYGDTGFNQRNKTHKHQLQSYKLLFNEQEFASKQKLPEIS